MSIMGDSVQLVWFLHDPANIDVPAIFSDLTGHTPDSTRTNRSPLPMDPIRALAEKVIGEHHVSLGLVSSARLELAFHPAKVTTSPPIATLHVDTALEEAAKMIAQARSLPPSLRLSCISKTIRLAQSRNDAKSLFANFIAFDPGIEGSMDELFQINSRTKFADVDGNRFTQVSISEITGIQIPLANPSQSPITHVRYALSVTYDFNTVPDGSIIDADRQTEIFHSIFSASTSAMEAGNLNFLR